MKKNRKHQKILDKLKVIQADITTLKVDAIVNSAHDSLMGGSGVDGAIHKAAGPLLLQECMILGGCEIGSAKITGAYNLPARHIIHTVGPVWNGGSFNEEELLASCYRESLELARQYNIKTIAFPSISTGAFAYPIEQASIIALKTVSDYLTKHNGIEKVIFVVFSDKDLVVYTNALNVI